MSDAATPAHPASPTNQLIADALSRVAESVPAAVDGLTADQLAYRPGTTGNPIGWLIWHLTRVLDIQVADLAGQEQVWLAAGFAEEFALDLPVTDHGYGHTTEQVDKVRPSAGQLVSYHAAVQAQFAPYLATVADFDRIVDTRWDPPVTLLVRLVSVIDESARHIGQAEYVRGLLPPVGDPDA